MDREVRQLLDIINQAYDHSSWHGTNLRGSIRRVTLDEAVWRPVPSRHNIWETVIHAAYWKYAVSRRFTGDARGSFPLKGSNWFKRPQEQSEKAWKADVALLDQMHRAVVDAVNGLSARKLGLTPPGKKASNFAVLSGIAAHDLYHAGQIQLLKKLYSSQSTR
jgi:hypothetical protein